MQVAPGACLAQHLGQLVHRFICLQTNSLTLFDLGTVNGLIGRRRLKLLAHFGHGLGLVVDEIRLEAVVGFLFFI